MTPFQISTEELASLRLGKYVLCVHPAPCVFYHAPDGADVDYIADPLPEDWRTVRLSGADMWALEHFEDVRGDNLHITRVQYHLS